MSFEISPLQESDIPELTTLHCLVFPNSRSTQLGKKYVKKMFKWFLQNQPCLSFVAVQDDQIIGYVVGAIGGYGRKLFRYALVEIVLGLMMHPLLWFKKETFTLWPSYLKGLFPRSRPQKTQNENPLNPVISAALAGIGVDPGKQGMGIGRTLVMNFENAARDLNVTKLTLSVHLDNYNARQLYERCGWYTDNEDISKNSAHYTKIISG